VSRKRWFWIGGAAAAALLIAVAGVDWLLESRWLRDQARARIVEAVESATGGRAEIGDVHVQWRRLRAEAGNFTLHGTEPADKPPLFRASRIAVGVRILSVLQHDIHVESLEITDPRIYLIVASDGRTNIPEPKVKRGGANPVEAVVNLAIGRFDIRNGIFEVENRGKTPFDARGRNLNARLSYEGAGSRYRGDLSMRPLELRWPGYAPVPFSVDLGVSIERNRIGIDSATLATGDSRLSLAGAVENLAAPTGKFRYDARLAVPDAVRILRLDGLERGTVEASGDAVWEGGSRFSAAGSVRARDVDYRDSAVRLRDCRLDGQLAMTQEGIEVSAARVSGNYLSPLDRLPVSGGISKAAFGHGELNLRGVALDALGGGFRGEATLRDLDRFSVTGRISEIDARRAVALYSREPIPWDALASGEVKVEGSIRRRNEKQVSATLSIGPAGDGPPVHGQISAQYDAKTGVVDLGRSSMILPSSRADFSGALDREMRVRLETRDLNDLLPAVGRSAASVPVKLASGGKLLFTGTVTGSLDHPRIAGRLAMDHFSISGKDLDSLAGLVAVSPDNVRIDNGTASWKSLRARFRGAVSLAGWQAGDTSRIFGDGSLRGAAVGDVLTLANAGDVPLSGTLGGSVQFAGTVGRPIASGDFEIVRGVLRSEPFDRFTGHLSYGGDTVELASGQAQAGAKQVQVAAAFHHASQRFDSGRLHFQLATNRMPIEQIETLAKARPGIQGAVQVNASGDLDVTPQQGGANFRLATLEADATGSSLQYTGQPLGNAHLTAHTEGLVLKASLDADLAESAVHGEGQWKLDGDYPGSATVTIANFDFVQAQPWLPRSAAGRFAGSADGEIRINGPVLKPEKIEAELRLPKLNLTPPAKSGIPESLALRNSGPVVATLANSEVTIQSAHLVGRATDITVTGKMRLNQKSPLDLRVNGRVDLGVLHDFDRSLDASGIVSTDTAVRGELGNPEINGRMEFHNAAFSVVDFPNGMSGANGVILFTGSRATIQRFSGETGGGRIDLTGFASYNGGPLVFHLHATAKEVRVRYPEGVSTVADANLSFTGTTDRSNLSGTFTILRTGFTFRSDFSSLIAKSAEPVQTPSARTGLLGGLNFDIQINTSPDIQFQSSLTQDLQVEANLRLRGTASNPALVGRINITHGQVVFYGTRFNINQGSIAFYNPLKVEPILDVDLETKARGIDITLTVSGPLNKLNLTPRSDPPLQFNEIVALLATGRTPTSDPTLLAQQATAPNAWQQAGASALLGQAIASPVTGRLQRFFGVSKLRIDPTLPGVENNPQARLTLEQQVTPEITFTYITNVTSSNPQVIRVEWALSKQWSVVALREENGIFGLDFFYRKRF
jgi:translocation and assembly module TamB